MQDHPASDIVKTEPDVPAPAHDGAEPENDLLLELDGYAMLIAQLAEALDESPENQTTRFMILPPTAEAIDQLSKIESFVISLRLVIASGDEPQDDRSDLISEISSWPVRTPQGRKLLVLYTRSGVQVGIEDDRVFAFRPETIQWTGPGRLQGQPAGAKVDPA